MKISSKKIMSFAIILLQSILVRASCPRISFKSGGEDRFKSFLTESQVKETMSLFNDPNMDKKLHDVISTKGTLHDTEHEAFEEVIKDTGKTKEDKITALKKIAHEVKEADLLALTHECTGEECIFHRSGGYRTEYQNTVAKKLADLMNKRNGEPIAYMSIGSGTLLPDLFIIHQALTLTKASNISLKIYFVDPETLDLKPFYDAFNLQNPSFDSIDEMIQRIKFEENKLAGTIGNIALENAWYTIRDLIEQEIRLYKFMSWLVWTAGKKLQNVDLYGCPLLNDFKAENKHPRSIDVLVGIDLDSERAQKAFEDARKDILKPDGISIGGFSGVESEQEFAHANAMNTALQTLKEVFDELDRAFFKKRD
jgi:hypothetical protein